MCAQGTIRQSLMKANKFYYSFHSIFAKMKGYGPNIGKGSNISPSKREGGYTILFVD